MELVIDKGMSLCADEATFYFNISGNGSEYNDAQQQNYSDSIGLMGSNSIIERGAAPTVPGGYVSDQFYRPITFDSKDMKLLKYYSYGIVLPTICILGI